VERKDMVELAKTGLYVNIKGTGPSDSQSKVNTVAFRTELDALEMPELNEDLPYKTVTKGAHMCGHDGHMCIILLAAEFLCKKRS